MQVLAGNLNKASSGLKNVPKSSIDEQQCGISCNWDTFQFYCQGFHEDKEKEINSNYSDVLSCLVQLPQLVHFQAQVVLNLCKS